MDIFSYRYDRIITDDNRIVTVILMLYGVFMLFTESFQRFKSRFLIEHKPVKLKATVYTRKKSREEQQVNAVQHNVVTEELKMLDIYFSSDVIRDVKLNLKTAASDLRITQRTLSEMIFALYGTTFAKLLTKKRIEYACLMLLTPEFEDTLENLSRICGFKSVASFYRNFRALQQCSPTEFRHRYVKSVN